jgi:hypothetical protein
VKEMDKHQLAGFDARERGFTRTVEFDEVEGGVRAILRYETTRVVTAVRETPVDALNELIHLLQGQGYTQLRSQLSVRDGTYLGSQEPWIEYPDPERNPELSGGWLDRLVRCFQPRREHPHG